MAVLRDDAAPIAFRAARVDECLFAVLDQQRIALHNLFAALQLHASMIGDHSRLAITNQECAAKLAIAFAMRMTIADNQPHRPSRRVEVIGVDNETGIWLQGNRIKIITEY